jgi:outer membrane protein
MLRLLILAISLIYSSSVFATKVLVDDQQQAFHLVLANSLNDSIAVVAATIPANDKQPFSAVDKQQSLLDIYQQALSKDPTLASALSANQAAQELIEQGKALYRPTVNFNAGTSASQTNIQYIGTAVPFGAGGRTHFESYNYGVDARQPIFRKQNLVQMDQAKTQVSQADKQLHLSQQDLILRTTQSYFEVLIAQDKIDLIVAQKAAILSQLEQAKAHFEAGAVTIVDVNEAQARYDLVEAQEIAAINEHQIARRALQAITGEAPQKLASVKTDIKTNSLEQSLDKWLAVAVQNNLNMQIQQDILKLSEQEVDRLRAGHLPTLDAVASYTNNYANGSANGFGSDLKSSTIGLQLQIPLYQGGALSSQVRQAVLNKQKAQDDLEIERRKAELETQRAYLNLNTSIAQVKAYEQALSSSQSQLDSTQLGYEVGVRTSVDMLNAQQQLFSAKRDLLQARYNYLVNIIRLKMASGIVAEADLADINQQLVLIDTAR